MARPKPNAAPGPLPGQLELFAAPPPPVAERAPKRTRKGRLEGPEVVLGVPVPPLEAPELSARALWRAQQRRGDVAV